ncbi:MAG: RluA family pseudouridine synthase [Rikenellaceae bacterium]
MKNNIEEGSLIEENRVLGVVECDSQVDDLVDSLVEGSLVEDSEIEDSEIEDSEIEGSEELYEHFSVTADAGQGLLRIDKFLSTRLMGRSRSSIQAASDSGSVLVNGSAVKSSYKVKPLDQVSIVLPYPKREYELLGENIPLNIVYEDDYLLIVNKEAGMVVHPGHGNRTGTLVNALTYHLSEVSMFQQGDLRAGLVHRIDKDTSGLLVVAKDEYTHVGLAKQFFDHTTQRLYHALVWGNFDEDEGTIVGNIGRNLKDRLQMFVFPEGSEEGKHAVTHWRVIERFGYVTLVECRLETGRTHQIRAHMKSIGHPLFNDERYGGDRILKGTTYTKYKQFVENCFKLMPRQGLHAMSLGFVHPRTKECMNFESEYPSDFASCIEKWRGYGFNPIKE